MVIIWGHIWKENKYYFTINLLVCHLQILEMLLVKSTDRYFSRSRNVFSRTDFLTVASDVIARARAAQGEKQTIKTFTYLILDRHLHKVGFNIFFLLNFFFSVKKDKLGVPSHRGNCQKNSPEV